MEVLKFYSQLPGPVYAIIDVSFQMLLGVVINWPVIRVSDRKWIAIALSAISSVFIDTDHSWSAHSINPSVMVANGERTWLHSPFAAFVFAWLFAIIAIHLSKSHEEGHRVMWIILTAFMAHILWDSYVGGVPLFWPFKPSGVRLEIYVVAPILFFWWVLTRQIGKDLIA